MASSFQLAGSTRLCLAHQRNDKRISARSWYDQQLSRHTPWHKRTATAKFASGVKDRVSMAKNEAEKTLADYVASVLSPVLIMALVGSLVFFLIKVLYASEFE